MKRWMKFSVIIIAIVVIVLYLKSYIDMNNIMHDRYANEITEEEFISARNGLLINEYQNWLTIGNTFPEAHKSISNHLGRREFWLHYPEIIYATENPPYFLMTNSYDEQRNTGRFGILFNSASNSSKDIPLGPWIKYEKCNFLHLDMGCHSGEGTTVTRSGHLFLNISNSSNIYDKKLFGKYFYDGNRWHRLTRETNSGSEYVKNDGCNLYYAIGDKFYHIDVCKALGLANTVKEPVKKTISFDNKELGVLFDVNNITFEERGFSLETTPVKCEKLNSAPNFIIDFGDKITIETKCDNYVKHGYKQPGTYVAKVLFEGEVIES